MEEALQDWIVGQILLERERQDRKWGVQRHPHCVWSAVLSEECGEVSKACLEEDYENLKEELNQVAAVCIAWLEHLHEHEKV